MSKCNWKEEETGYFETSCNNAFAINDGMPSENKMEYCCFCGKPIFEIPYNNANAADAEPLPLCGCVKAPGCSQCFEMWE